MPKFNTGDWVMLIVDSPVAGANAGAIGKISKTNWRFVYVDIDNGPANVPLTRKEVEFIGAE